MAKVQRDATLADPAVRNHGAFPGPAVRTEPEDASLDAVCAKLRHQVVAAGCAVHLGDNLTCHVLRVVHVSAGSAPQILPAAGFPVR
eukprot:109464-Prorocentrum_minimum.AAC.1